MAVKTFVVGEVLTSDATNTYLANSGLVFVKSQVVGSAVPTVTVNNAFSSTYDNYQVTYTGFTSSANTFVAIRFSTPGSAYYGSLYYDSYTGTTGTSRTNNGAALDVGRCTLNSAENTVFLNIANPNKANRTGIVGNYFGDGYSGWSGGTNAASTQFTDLTFLPASGTLTGGTITVYGYRVG